VAEAMHGSKSAAISIAETRSGLKEILFNMNARKNVLFIFSPDIKDIVVKVGLLGKASLVPAVVLPSRNLPPCKKKS
jgi:hypothetical protein